MTMNISGDYITFPDGARQANANVGEGALTSFYHPDSNFSDLYRSGFLPSWFNQQWGGAQWGGLPDGSFGSVATGSVEDVTDNQLGVGAPQYYISQGFRISDSTTFDAAWVKLSKVGNPSYTITARIYTDAAGSPSAATGSAATLSTKLVTSKADGEWYRFTGLSAALTAGTQYHLVLTLSTTDASNYIKWRVGSTPKKYPHGGNGMCNGTVGLVWTPYDYTTCFLIQNPAANSILQSGGMFDYKLSFAAGTPVNQSRSVAQPLINFFDGRSCSVLYRGTYSANSNFFDMLYGIDHDRIVMGVDASGYPYVRLFETDGTVHTVAHNASITSGDHDVGIKARMVGDGADYLYLYVDGVSVGTPVTAATITMDAAMQRLGTARLGDGFPHLPTWTQDMQMTSLPSAQGWTWTGTATEANAMSIQGGKLYQNATGYTSTQTGYYQRTTTFVNATGWAVSWKCRVNADPNTRDDYLVSVLVQDGTSQIYILIKEYFLQANAGNAAAFVIQGDFKSQERVFTLCGQGTNYYLFIDGKLAVDGTGTFNTSAGGGNSFSFGDRSATASANADAIWSYVKYYQGGMLLPTASSGTCSEFAHWSGDKSALYASLWNSGSPVSVKQLCGVPRNYQFEQVVQREVRRGVTMNPSTTSTSLVLITDMELYVIGAYEEAKFTALFSNGTAATSVGCYTFVDGAQCLESFGYGLHANANANNGVTTIVGRSFPIGLHKIEQRWSVAAGTGTTNGSNRNLTVEARS
jgi:hypothetical protein